MQITIRPLDLSSDHELEQYAAVVRASDDVAFGGHEEQSLEELRVDFADTPTGTRSDTSPSVN